MSSDLFSLAGGSSHRREGEKEEEGEEEEKEYMRNITRVVDTKKLCISNHASVTQQNPVRYRDIVQWPYKTLLRSELDADKRALLLKVLEGPLFSEFGYCSLARDEETQMHSCIVRDDLSRSYLNQTKCGCTGKPIFPSVAEPPPSNPDEVRLVRDRWKNAAANAQKTSTLSGVPNRDEIVEWMRFCTIMLNTVRPHVLSCFKDQLNEACAPVTDENTREVSIYNAGGPKLPEYVDLLLEWERHVHAREVRDVLWTGDSTTQAWCFMHGKVGHLVPSRGFRGYDAHCFMCPVIGV